MTHRLSLDDVRAAMKRPLPGPWAQVAMAPRPRTLRPAEDASPRQAGVLLLLYPLDGEPYLVLTVRTPNLNHHSGQISLPGGGWEDQDDSLQKTALRETEEELGIDSADVEVLGPLTPLYIPPSNNCVYPYVALAPRRPDFHPDPIEVADLLEVPLSLLADPAIRREEEWIWRDAPLHVPFYAVDKHKVWGATATILAEFLALFDPEGGEL